MELTHKEFLKGFLKLTRKREYPVNNAIETEKQFLERYKNLVIIQNVSSLIESPAPKNFCTSFFVFSEKTIMVVF